MAEIFDNEIVEDIPHDVTIEKEVVDEMSASQAETARRKQLFEQYQASPEYQAKLKKRIDVNDACYRYPEARKLIYSSLMNFSNTKEMVDACIEFVDIFGFTFDPRPQANPNDLPFILYPYQRDSIKWLIEHIENGTDGLIEKSRDMGISWVAFVYVPIFYWLFKDSVNILIGSYKEDLVDNHNRDSLMGMIDYGIQSLPKWMMPRGWNPKKNRNHLKIVNPMNYNQITGDTMNPNFGRGTRKTCILFDELGAWDYAKDAWESASQSTSCRIANSTPAGYNFFAMLADSEIDKLTIHWSLHPLKDQQWYAYECSRNSPETVAQELDISYSKSQAGRVYPEWNDSNVTLGEFPYNPSWPLYTFWDFGNSDDTAMIWAQKNPENGKLRIVDTYAINGKTIGFYIPFVTGMIVENGYAYNREELACIYSHKAYRRATHFGDPAGRFKNSVVDSTVFSTLKDANIHVNFRDAWKEFGSRKGALRDLINRGIELNENNRTKYFNLCMLNASYPKVKQSGLEQINSVKPKHDYTSHYRSAFEYGALGLRDTTAAYRTVYDKFEKKDFTSKKRLIGY